MFGVDDVSGFIRFEEQVKVEATNFIDGHIPSTRVLIEQKSLGKDLRKGIVQSDGSVLNPFQQAKRYISGLPLSQHPRWIVTCNFAEFLVYDMEQPNGEPEHIFLKDLGKEYYRLQFLVNVQSEHLSKEMQVSMQAGEIVGRIYEALLKQYDDGSAEALRWLNILCVRIVFCLYAEDAGVFAHDQFHDYLASYEAKDLRRALDAILEEKVERTRNRRLDEYRSKLASLTFLDPACGSGNFLTETYLSLRRLENEAIRERYHGQSFLGMEEASPVQVSIQQFYGIEINDFAVTVATTALWISEAQMLRKTERIIAHDLDFLPLRSYTNIREGNALRMDWDKEAKIKTSPH